MGEEEPTTQEPLTEIEIHALSLVGDSNCATTGIGTDPLTQDDSDDSEHTNTERPDDRSTASNSGVTQSSPDFTTVRDDENEEEEEEPLILEPVEVEVGVEMEEDTPAPCGPTGTSSTTESIFRGFPHGSSDSVRPSAVQQYTPSVAATEVGAEKVICCTTDSHVPGHGASVAGQRRHRSRAAQGHGYDSRKHRSSIRTAVGG
uniref:uncharacterized protein n=1 Tax=Pristiophorus japonicus TaxID=55135 RepID=UPI00398EBFA3